MKFFWVSVLAYFLFSCNQENKKYNKPYFDFDSLVHYQIQKLVTAKASVAKRTFLNGKKDSTTLVPDTAQWKHELDVFHQLDVINKPMYKGNYQQNTGADDHSNLMVRSLTARIKSPVMQVKFFYQDDKRLKRIESVFTEGNVLYSTSRKLTLEFEEQQGVPLISGYHVRGFQKMILSDSVLFSIDGRLTY
jgi:hypothetical protein